MEIIKVMVIGSDDNKIYELKSLLRNDELAFAGFAKITDTALEKVESIKPNTVIIQTGSAENEVFELAQKIYVRMPGCSVIIIGDKFSVEEIERAMLAGVRKVLQFPVNTNTLIEHIKAAYNLEKVRNTNNPAAAFGVMSKVISVFRAKGGIGKTTIAVNVATILARMSKKVLVIDADLQFGDVNVFFDIDTKESILELTEETAASDIDAIKRVTALHSSGVNVLQAPKSPEYAEYVLPKHLEKIINTVRPHFDYVIIDTTPSFNEITIAALENSDMILMISGMDISILRNTKTSMNILDSLQQADKLELVVNKITGGIITLKDIQKVLNSPIKNKLSLDYKTALTAHNKGIPIVIDAPRSGLAAELTELAHNVSRVLSK